MSNSDKNKYICSSLIKIKRLTKAILKLYQFFEKCTGVCTDTRTLRSGQIFFALKGPNFNGNLYAKKALENGAILAVIDEAKYDLGDDYFLVEDVLRCLQLLANYHRIKFNIPIFAITGSNGKTTTKELTAKILSEQYKVHYTKGNLNNHIGVPITLLSMPKDTEFAIIEMGANHLSDITELCDIAEPTHGLITNIGNAHLGEFGGRENLIRAKSELFDYLRKNEGIVFINCQDPVLNNMVKRFPEALLYPNSDCQLVTASPFVNYLDDQGYEHTTDMIGEYNFMNISAAITIGKFFDVEYPYDAVDRYIPNNNRSQIVDIKSNKVVLDAYNANPASMEAALKNLSCMTGDRKIAMLGDMKELGEYASAEHLKIVEYAKTMGIEEVFWVGADFGKVVKSKSKIFESVDHLIKHLEKAPLEGATVLIKGSRSMKMEQLIQNQNLWT